MKATTATRKLKVAEWKDEDHSLNEVILRGRVSGEPHERELPSGDRVVEF